MKKYFSFFQKPVVNSFLPICIKVQEFQCLVVGGGKVAIARIEKLLLMKATVTIISPTIIAKGKKFLNHPSVVFKKRKFRYNDLNYYNLIFTCTNSIQVNSQIELRSKKLGLLINRADQGEGNFVLPAFFKKDPIMVSVMTHKMLPSLSKEIKNWLELLITNQIIKKSKLLIKFKEKLKQAPIPMLHYEKYLQQWSKWILNSKITPKMYAHKIQTGIRNIKQKR
jgi:precorrin-2 dehydrogenase/sirohydrochlorin ferrochelatase